MSQSGGQEHPEPIVLRLTHPLSENPTSLEFEIYVKEQIESWGFNLEDIEIKHLDKLQSYDGDYKIDITVRFRAFGGMNFLCLFECKHHKYPVKRRDVESLPTRLHSVGGHKGVMVSRSGFQAGAIAFAKTHGIAAITIAGYAAIHATNATMWPYN